jgi:hypothetical protein
MSMNQVTDRSEEQIREDKKIRKVLIGFFVLFGVGVPLAWLQDDLQGACFMLGGLLLYIWFYLNPWALQLNFVQPEKYLENKREHDAFLFAAIIVLAMSFILF